MNDLQVNLKDVLLASQSLSDMADVYDDVIGKLKTVDNGDGDLFESGKGVAGKWNEVLNAYWQVCADSQTNLHDTSRAIVHFINEVCAQDGTNAEDLRTQVQQHNDNIFDELDIDDDGRISANERTRAGYSQEQFDELDTNDDGSISREEQKADTVHPPLPEPNDSGDIIDLPGGNTTGPPNPPEGN